MITETKDRLLRVVNPATGETLDTMPAATADDVDTAVDRAHRVFDSGVWATRPPRALRLAELMERDAEIRPPGLRGRGQTHHGVPYRRRARRGRVDPLVRGGGRQGLRPHRPHRI